MLGSVKMLTGVDLVVQGCRLSGCKDSRLSSQVSKRNNFVADSYTYALSILQCLVKVGLDGIAVTSKGESLAARWLIVVAELWPKSGIVYMNKLCLSGFTNLIQSVVSGDSIVVQLGEVGLELCEVVGSARLKGCDLLSWGSKSHNGQEQRED